MEIDDENLGFSKSFAQQHKLIEKYDRKFRKTNSRTKRISFLEKMNKECLSFYLNEIIRDSEDDLKIYYFSFWIGTLYLTNLDITIEIKNAISFSPYFCDLQFIIEFLHRKNFMNFYRNKYVLQDVIILEKKIRLEELYSTIIPKIIRIQTFFRKCLEIQRLKKYIFAISHLKQKFPLEIVESIIIKPSIYFHDTLLEVIIKYQKDISLILSMMDVDQLSKLKKRYVAQKYLENDYDLVDTIMDCNDTR